MNIFRLTDTIFDKVTRYLTVIFCFFVKSSALDGVRWKGLSNDGWFVTYLRFKMAKTGLTIYRNMMKENKKA